MFGRKIKFIVRFPDDSTLEYDERYNIVFDINKFFADGDDGLNTAVLTISNLNNTNRKKIEQSAESKTGERDAGNFSAEDKGKAYLEIYAGYNKYNLIFRGAIRNVAQEKKSVDIDTVIYAYDDSLRFFTAQAIKSKSLKAFLQDTYPFDLDYDFYDRVIENTTFNENFRDVLKKLSSKFGFSYSIDDGVLRIRKPVIEPVNPKIISRESGMISIPEVSSTGCKIQVLLSADYHLMDTVELNARFGSFNIGNLTFRDGVLQGTDVESLNKKFGSLNGKYTVFNINHKGESRGNVFITSLDCRNPSFEPVQEG